MYELSNSAVRVNNSVGSNVKVGVIANSLEELEERYLARKSNMESKGLRVNIGKTKIMKSGANEGPVFASGKYPGGVYSKG